MMDVAGKSHGQAARSHRGKKRNPCWTRGRSLWIGERTRPRVPFPAPSLETLSPPFPRLRVSDWDVADSTRGRVRSPQNPGAPGAVSELFLSSFNLF